MFIAFVYASVFKNVNKLDFGMRAHQNTWGECHRHGKGIRKEMKKFRAFVGIWGSAMDASRYAGEPWQFQCICTLVFLLGDKSRQS